jgi:hypothetical protein
VETVQRRDDTGILAVVVWRDTMATPTKPKARRPKARMLNRGQWMSLVDRAACRELGISGEEFVRRLKAEEFGDLDDHPKVMRVAMLLPSGW